MAVLEAILLGMSNGDINYVKSQKQKILNKLESDRNEHLEKMKKEVNRRLTTHELLSYDIIGSFFISDIPLLIPKDTAAYKFKIRKYNRANRKRRFTPYLGGRK